MKKVKASLDGKCVDLKGCSMQTPHLPPPKKKSKFDKSAMSSERHRNDFLAQSFSWIVSILYQSIQTCIRLYQAISKWDGPVCFFYQSRTRSRVKKSTRHAENPQKFGKPIRTTRCGMKTHTPLLDPFQMKDKKKTSIKMESYKQKTRRVTSRPSLVNGFGGEGGITQNTD